MWNTMFEIYNNFAKSKYIDFKTKNTNCIKFGEVKKNTKGLC